MSCHCCFARPTHGAWTTAEEDRLEGIVIQDEDAIEWVSNGHALAHEQGQGAAMGQNRPGGWRLHHHFGPGRGAGVPGPDLADPSQS